MRAVLALLGPVLLAAFAPPAAAESLYKCTGPKGEVSIQSEPCPKGSTQVWKREATPDPAPSAEELAARAALAEAQALEAAEAARLAELQVQAEQARVAREAQAEEGDKQRTKSECTKAHEFQEAALAKDFLRLTEAQQAELRAWVVAQCAHVYDS